MTTLWPAMVTFSPDVARELRNLADFVETGQRDTVACAVVLRRNNIASIFIMSATMDEAKALFLAAADRCASPKDKAA